MDQLLAVESDNAREKATEILETVVATDPENAQALLNLALLLQISGRVAEAVDLYEQHLQIRPDNVVALNNLAWLLCEEQHEYQLALELAEQGLALAPDYLDIMDTRGVAFHRVGQLDKAIADFSVCIERYPDTSPGLAGSCFHMGRALAQLGNKAEAVRNLQRAQEISEKVGGLTDSDLAEIQSLVEELAQGN